MFITVEGIEGCGKTTQLRRLTGYLQERGLQVAATREPGGTHFGESVRSIFLDPQQKIGPRAEILLITAARVQHIEEVIRPALDAGKTVVCDRYLDSTLAYQGYGREQPMDLILRLHEELTGNLMPDLTLLFDCPAHVGLVRRQNQSGTIDRVEASAIDFHERVRAGYLERARAEPERFRVFNSELAITTVYQLMQNAIDAHFGWSEEEV